MKRCILLENQQVFYYRHTRSTERTRRTTNLLSNCNTTCECCCYVVVRRSSRSKWVRAESGGDIKRQVENEPPGSVGLAHPTSLSLSSLPTTDVDKLGCFQNIHSPPFIYLQSFLSLPCIICVAMENTGQSAILYSERQWIFC